MKIKAIRPVAKADASAEYQEWSIKVLKSYASPGTELTVVFPDAPPNMGPWMGHTTEARIEAMAPYMAQEAVKAEEGGFDAVLFVGEWNVGAEIARHLVNIPLISTGPVALHAAALVGSRICILIMEDSCKPYARNLLKRWGMSHFVTSIKAWNIPVYQHRDSGAEIKERTIKLSKEAIEEEDAEVILPFGALYVPTMVPVEEIQKEVSVPIINQVAIGVKMTEMFVNLKMRHSSKAYPAVI